MAERLITHELTITGYVQGVGFRAFVASTARALDVRGETWNSTDGSVRVIAQHAGEETLKRFEEEMENGPGRVDAVRAEPIPHSLYRSFEITASR